MAKYKISDRVPPSILEASKRLIPLVYPFHTLFPPRFASDQQFADDLKQRFKAIPYPYNLARAKGTQPPSTYEILQKRGAADSLFEPHVIEPLHLWVEDNEQWYKIRLLRFANTDAGKKFRKFHVPLAKDLVRHVNVLQKLKASYELAEEWIGPYVRTAEERLMYEIALLRVCTEENPESDTSATRRTIELVFDSVSHALTSANTTNRSLACHLTSIVCCSNCLTTKVLVPSPETVGKRLARRSDKSSRKSRN
jgi:hypothetical protein